MEGVEGGRWGGYGGRRDEGEKKSNDRIRSDHQSYIKESIQLNQPC